MVLTEEELAVVKDLYKKCCSSTAAADKTEAVLSKALSDLSPLLLVKLRQQQGNKDKAVRTMSQHINTLLDRRMKEARDTLSALLEAGELRKLDAMIGKAARDGKLDVAFFNVLTMNLQDAAAKQETAATASTTEDDAGGGDDDDATTASRLQILQHVYTRCQEEVEKTIPPGKALLNKLLRTAEAPIRKNIYEHYLTRKDNNTIQSPDGTVIELPGDNAPLVAVSDFVQAVSDAVVQIRNVESTGAVDRESGAMMVESCRQVAKEARIVIGESFGIESKELEEFQQGLEPVFRPTSADSPYIQGNATQSATAAATA